MEVEASGGDLSRRFAVLWLSMNNEEYSGFEQPIKALLQLNPRILYILKPNYRQPYMMVFCFFSILQFQT